MPGRGGSALWSAARSRMAAVSRFLSSQKARQRMNHELGDNVDLPQSDSAGQQTEAGVVEPGIVQAGPTASSSRLTTADWLQATAPGWAQVVAAKGQGRKTREQSRAIIEKCVTDPTPAAEERLVRDDVAVDSSSFQSGGTHGRVSPAATAPVYAKSTSIKVDNPNASGTDHYAVEIACRFECPECAAHAARARLIAAPVLCEQFPARKPKVAEAPMLDSMVGKQVNPKSRDISSCADFVLFTACGPLGARNCGAQAEDDLEGDAGVQMVF